MWPDTTTDRDCHTHGGDHIAESTELSSSLKIKLSERVCSNSLLSIPPVHDDCG